MPLGKVAVGGEVGGGLSEHVDDHRHAGGLTLRHRPAHLVHGHNAVNDDRVLRATQELGHPLDSQLGLLGAAQPDVKVKQPRRASDRLIWLFFHK